jgi:transcriptional regulator GlxA family with amidase domain
LNLRSRHPQVLQCPLELVTIGHQTIELLDHFPATGVDSHLAIARRSWVTPATLCGFFKRATGRIVTEYVPELRVGAAAQLLISAELSAREIALRVGSENYANFSQ